MPEKYKKYTENFKQTLMQKIFKKEITGVAAIKKYGLSSSTLHVWKKRYSSFPKDPFASTKPLSLARNNSELKAQLLHQIEELEKKQEVLRKALTIL